MNTFKKFTPVFALVAVMFAFAPQQAEAHGRCKNHKSYTYVSGHTKCGCPIYTKRYVRYYQPCGRPVYGYHRQPVRHTCRQHHYRPVRHYYGSCGTYRPYHHQRVYRSSSCGTRSGISVTYRSGW